MAKFSCPVCSSRVFTSLSNGTRMCLGHVRSNHPVFLGAFEPCVFTWPRVDDWKYGLAAPSVAPEESGQFDVGAFVSDAL
jgi:hypothetical protein